ncbi:hypothetical protein GUITHDRAFT_154241 [Guillardia theta CCMP2712]|uniref:Uncharacterized protein n=1 Tax=Guillardia theta (strain CCMP2712) TaxID=905079 RepID=L1IW83_GUITC|nr:hypothetical protein GUITHDRAFT_154241 [Guillardia theta CCMP2712]EKX40105.1 hypothetical protein GUITHDRAFT_154241 [Guillardia theta CCMP2712]|mmetsp:Transcript_17875/g.58761  ORF Transcript_17875/g.58761 Transcript_17875/m.58761 type:complete len:308 (-) Transcript_17875:1373-2296(-)|eukprot:XP_005827085.1 hypothetical protein GUITHDRAFT_154241 [Guillardia theta CCMP2712]
MWNVSDMCDDLHHRDFSSLDMLKLIFPSTYSFLSHQVPYLLGISVIDRLFPPWTVRQCPEIRWEVELPEERRLYLRNPTLILIQLSGILVGIVGALHWFHGSRRRRELVAQTSTWCLSWSWMFSFLWFAAMNASSVLVHSFFEPISPAWRLWLACDVTATGMASTNALLAIAPLPQLQGSLTAVTLLNVLLGTIAANLSLLEWSWREEMLYVLPTIIAALALSLSFLGRVRRSEASRKEIFFFLLMVLTGALPLLLAPLSTPALCSVLGSLVFGLVHLAFLSSVNIYLLMMFWLAAAREGEEEKKRK